MHKSDTGMEWAESRNPMNQQVIVYICSNSWKGSSQETEEMKPRWFETNSIPNGKMWKDDIYWLPEVLKGHYVEATFEFDTNEDIADHNVTTKQMPTTV